jgi:hypothetical protein
MAWQEKVKVEVAEWWRWMRRQNPSETEKAQQWVQENPDEMKKLDRMLYRSAEKYYAKNISLSPADAETMDAADNYSEPDAFLPEDVRDRIYDDQAWFVREKYLTKEFDGDPALHLQKEIVEGLHQLTELQREIIFRNIRRSVKKLLLDAWRVMRPCRPLGGCCFPSSCLPCSSLYLLSARLSVRSSDRDATADSHDLCADVYQGAARHDDFPCTRVLAGHAR